MDIWANFPFTRTGAQGGPLRELSFENDVLPAPKLVKGFFRCIRFSVGAGGAIVKYYVPVSVTMAPFSWDRMERAVEKVRERLLRAVVALEQARVDYAVAGGNAVAAWVARVDEAAVRNTRDVDLLIRREDLASAIKVLEEAGFFHRHVSGLDLLLDAPDSSARDAVHLVFANEMVRPGEPGPNPDVTESESADLFRIVNLKALVQMKLTAWRDKDRVHLRDLIEIGLVDRTWTQELTGELAERLNQLLDNPLG